MLATAAAVGGMSINPNVHDNIRTVEYGSYVKVENDSRFPSTSAYNQHNELATYPHYAVLTKSVDTNLPGLGIALSDDYEYISKFGYNPDCDTLINEAIWSPGGVYPWSTWDAGAQTLFFKSTDSGDTSVDITFQGLDANYTLTTATSTTDASNGTTGVELGGTWSRMFRAYVTSNSTLAGNIEIRAGSASGTVVAQIDDIDQQTMMAVYTIPVGYTGYIAKFDTTIEKNEDAIMRLQQRDFGGAFRTIHVAEIYQNAYIYDFTNYLAVYPKTDIQVLATPTNNNARVTANFDIILVPDP